MIRYSRRRMRLAVKLALLALVVALVQVKAAPADQLGRAGRFLLTWPNCDCITNTTQSPYRLVYDKQGTEASKGYKGEEWFCFLLKLDYTGTQCNATDAPACCKQDAYKIELEVSPNCKGATTRALLFKGINTVVNGVPVKETIKTISVEIDNTATSKSALVRISQLNIPLNILEAFPGGLPVCINLVSILTPEGKDYICPPPVLFDGAGNATTSFVQYSLFNKNKKCCPTSVAVFDWLPPFTLEPPSPPSPSVPPLPSPSLSPPPPLFPYCDCNTYDPAAFPWRVSVYSKEPVTVGGKPAERVCLKLSVDNATAASCDNTFQCCSQGLTKIEMLGNPICKGAISPFTLTGSAGTKSSYLWGTSPKVPWVSVLKFTKLDLTYSQGQAGALLCFNLKGSTCNKWTDLCPGGMCQAATFSPQEVCCPQLFLASSR